MERGEITARTNAQTVRGNHPFIKDVISRVEDSYYQAQQLMHQAVDILGEGHKTLRGWALSQTSEEPLLDSPQLSLESIAHTHRPQDESALYEGWEATPVQVPGNDAVACPLLRIYCLGKFRVCQGERVIDSWRTNKAKGILKLLLLNMGRPMPKDALIEVFWKDFPAESANNSFRVAMHELRQKLSSLDNGREGPRYILSDGNNYSLNIQAPLWIDIEEFEARWRAGRALEKLGQQTAASAEYMRAEGLYKGDFLEEDVYDDWSLVRRESLVDTYLSVLRKMCIFYFKAADYESCIEFSQKLLAKDRCREDAYQHLIMCYSKLGLRSRALRWYRICEETLRQELDCPVSPETAALYNSLMR